MRWLLCVLLALLVVPFFAPDVRARAADELVEFEDDDMADFPDDGYGEPVAPPPPGAPVPMDMTMEQFVEAYNAACCEDECVQGPAQREGTMLGITYLAVGDKAGLYAQLAIDPSGQVLIAGAKLDADEDEDDPDLSGFASVAAAVMCVAFPDLSCERRESLLGQVLSEGDRPGAGGASLSEGTRAVNYVVHDDGERAILMYHTQA